MDLNRHARLDVHATTYEWCDTHPYLRRCRLPVTTFLNEVFAGERCWVGDNTLGMPPGLFGTVAGWVRPDELDRARTLLARVPARIDPPPPAGDTCQEAGLRLLSAPSGSSPAPPVAPRPDPSAPTPAADPGPFAAPESAIIPLPGPAAADQPVPPGADLVAVSAAVDQAPDPGAHRMRWWHRLANLVRGT